ncbi:hypothetical protein [Streptomyces sp. NPDC002520]
MLDPTQRAAFAVVADVLIPAAGDMPSASAAGVPGALLDQVLSFRPDLAAPFETAVAACVGKEPEAALDELTTSAPELFAALTLLTAGAYFLSPQVKEALDYEPAPRVANDDVDTYVDMLEAVVDRGFLIR